MFAEDVLSPEGPVSLADGSWYVAQMLRGVVSHVSAEGTTRTTVATTSRPNGLALDRSGRLWVAESSRRALLSIGPGAGIAVISTGAEGVPFMWPNDLCIGPDGYIYMTDSGVPVDDFEPVRETTTAYDVATEGRVFRIDPRYGNTEVLDAGLRFANGIAFEPNGEALFVAETLTGSVYRYAVERAGPAVRLGAREHFCTVTQEEPWSCGRVAGPDGMAFDRAGRLYVAVLSEGVIAVVESNGSVVQRHALTGDFPTNVAFSRSDPTQLLIAEVSKRQLLIMTCDAPGAELFATTR